MSASSVKISPHLFHGLYLFGYISEQINQNYDNGPKQLYANWPIINLVPKKAKKDNNWIEFTSFEKVVEYLYKDNSDNLSNGRSPSTRQGDKFDVNNFCKNYFTVKIDDVSKNRGLFHGMMSHFTIKHKFEVNADGKSEGAKDRTCCKKGSYSFTAVYEEGNGHQCDRAVFGFYVGGSSVGTINLNNGNDGGSRRSGPFRVSDAVMSKVLVPVEVKCNTDDCHNGITVIQVKNVSGEVVGSVGLSEGKQCLRLCDQPKCDYSKELCCCPPKFFKSPEGGNDSSECGGITHVEATGYECNRSHSRKVQGDILLDSSKIFAERSLENRVGGKFSKRTIINPPKTQSSEPKNSDELDINDLKLIKDTWKIDSNAFKSLFDSKSFPFNSTKINDPILLISNIQNKDTKYLFSGAVVAEAYFKNKSFLKSSLDLQSRNLGDFAIKGSSSNIGVSTAEADSGDLFYDIAVEIKSIVFNETSKEFWFFVDFAGGVQSTDLQNISWNAGNYEYGSGYSQKDKKYYDLMYLNMDNEIYRNDISIASNKLYFIATEAGFGETAEEKCLGSKNGKLEKIKIPIKLNGESGSSSFAIEGFKFQKNSTKGPDENKCDSSSSSSKECNPDKCDIKDNLSINWAIKDLQIELFQWKKSNFSKGVTYPSKK